MEQYNNDPRHKVLLYIGETLIGDMNYFAKNRHLDESLKSEQESATSDQFTFDVSWKLFKKFVAKKFDDDPMSFLHVGKTTVIFIEDGRIRFAGWLAYRPAHGKILSLKFFEDFARLSGDLVCDPNNKMSPMRQFTNRPAHLYAQDLINDFKKHAAAAGETLKWDYGTVNTLANKTITYKDFQTVSKALCDAMNNVEGAGKFDVVVRTDAEDHMQKYVDILKPRGRDKNIIIKYPSDGVYKLWATDYSTEETNDYASEVLVAGNGQVGDPAEGEDTAELAAASNNNFVQEYCYWRIYDPQSGIKSQAAVQSYADKLLSQRDFGQQTPQIKLIGRLIAWGDAEDDDNGLAIGDGFYFMEEGDDGIDQSGWFRILTMATDYDDNGVATVVPKLLRQTD